MRKSGKKEETSFDPTFIFTPLMNAANSTRVSTLSAPIQRNIPGSMKKCLGKGEKGREKERGSVRWRHGFPPSVLFFFFPRRNPYTSMLVGLSQQTTPMTTRLKFHGLCVGSGVFSLSRNKPSLYDPSLRRDCPRSSSCRLSDPPSRPTAPPPPRPCRVIGTRPQPPPLFNTPAPA